ncbi:hypothetical protein JCM3765_001293 [Sporobolomyces pararoseus]
MASLKSLMKAKKESSRISHPHAKYSSSGQLSCSLCGSQLKSEAIWGSHLVSKQHRVNVQKVERQQQLLAEQEAAAARSSNGKRKSRSPSPSSPSSKRQRSGDSPPNNLPSDFYTSQEPVPSTSSASASVPVQQPAEEEEEEDPSIDEFLSTLSAEPSTTTGANSASATISAAPVKFEFGAPKIRAEGEENEEGEGEEEEEQGETEEERKEREEREEREEMMARLEEEEREQREADEKVTALKRRLELMRQAKKNKKA